MIPRILVVDDEESILLSLEGVLRDEGYEVAFALSGEEAVEKVDREEPDLVLLDVWLPGIDGIEALERIKSRHPAVPVVIMSGHGTIETAVRATKAGAYDFIEKPLNLERVLSCLESALRPGPRHLSA